MMQHVSLLPSRETLAGLLLTGDEFGFLAATCQHLSTLGIGGASLAGVFVITTVNGVPTARRVRSFTPGRSCAVLDENSTCAVSELHAHEPTPSEWPAVEASVATKILDGKWDHITYHEAIRIALTITALAGCGLALLNHGYKLPPPPPVLLQNEQRQRKVQGIADGAAARAALRDQLQEIMLLTPAEALREARRGAGRCQPWSEAAARELARGAIAAAAAEDIPQPQQPQQAPTANRSPPPPLPRSPPPPLPASEPEPLQPLQPQQQQPTPEFASQPPRASFPLPGSESEPQPHLMHQHEQQSQHELLVHSLPQIWTLPPSGAPLEFIPPQPIHIPYHLSEVYPAAPVIQQQQVQVPPPPPLPLQQLQLHLSTLQPLPPHLVSPFMQHTPSVLQQVQEELPLPPPPLPPPERPPPAPPPPPSEPPERPPLPPPTPAPPLPPLTPQPPLPPPTPSEPPLPSEAAPPASEAAPGAMHRKQRPGDLPKVSDLQSKALWQQQSQSHQGAAPPPATELHLPAHLQPQPSQGHAQGPHAQPQQAPQHGQIELLSNHQRQREERQRPQQEGKRRQQQQEEEEEQEQTHDCPSRPQVQRQEEYRQRQREEDAPKKPDAQCDQARTRRRDGAPDGAAAAAGGVPAGAATPRPLKHALPADASGLASTAPLTAAAVAAATSAGPVSRSNRAEAAHGGKEGGAGDSKRGRNPSVERSRSRSRRSRSPRRSGGLAAADRERGNGASPQQRRSGGDRERGVDDPEKQRLRRKERADLGLHRRKDDDPEEAGQSQRRGRAAGGGSGGGAHGVGASRRDEVPPERGAETRLQGGARRREENTRDRLPGGSGGSGGGSSGRDGGGGSGSRGERARSSGDVKLQRPAGEKRQAAGAAAGQNSLGSRPEGETRERGREQIQDRTTRKAKAQGPELESPSPPRKLQRTLKPPPSQEVVEHQTVPPPSPLPSQLVPSEAVSQEEGEHPLLSPLLPCGQSAAASQEEGEHLLPPPPPLSCGQSAAASQEEGEHPLPPPPELRTSPPCAHMTVVTDKERLGGGNDSCGNRGGSVDGIGGNPVSWLTGSQSTAPYSVERAATVVVAVAGDGGGRIAGDGGYGLAVGAPAVCLEPSTASTEQIGGRGPSRGSRSQCGAGSGAGGGADSGRGRKRSRSTSRSRGRCGRDDKDAGAAVPAAATAKDNGKNGHGRPPKSNPRSSPGSKSRSRSRDGRRSASGSRSRSPAARRQHRQREVDKSGPRDRGERSEPGGRAPSRGPPSLRLADSPSRHRSGLRAPDEVLGARDRDSRDFRRDFDDGDLLHPGSEARPPLAPPFDDYPHFGGPRPYGCGPPYGHGSPPRGPPRMPYGSYDFDEHYRPPPPMLVVPMGPPLFELEPIDWRRGGGRGPPPRGWARR